METAIFSLQCSYQRLIWKYILSSILTVNAQKAKENIEAFFNQNPACSFSLITVMCGYLRVFYIFVKIQMTEVVITEVKKNTSQHQFDTLEV